MTAPVMRELRGWLSPEARLLLAAARRNASPESLVPLIGDAFDWRLLEALARRQFATATLYARLRQLPEGVVPADVLQWLGAGSMVAEFRLRCLEQALLEATAILSQAGISVVLLKGAALALTAYPSFTDRGMQDLDLLVSPDDAARASQALQQAGWVPAYPETHEPFYARHHHTVPLIAPRLANARIELHTGLFPTGGPFTLTPDDMRRDAGTVTAAGQTLRVPSPAHMLLHLAVHFAWSDGMASGVLRTVQDIDALWSRVPNAGFAASFARMAADTRGRTCAYWTLRFARQLHDVPVPLDLLAALQPPRAPWMLDLLERHFAGVAGLTPVTCPSVRLSHALWSFGVAPEWSGHADARPWRAGEDWLAVAPARDSGSTGFWSAKRVAFSTFRRYAADLLR